MRMVLAVIVVIIGSVASAAEMKVHRSVPYAEPLNERRTLDIYAPVEGQDHPVVVWIHGGGWRKGGKMSVQQKPQAFVDHGCVFVSINYRLIPEVNVPEMTGDVGQAIAWVHQHIAEYGGQPKTIFVMGHSAGAHLAALVCTDGRYLEQAGLSLKNIKGCVPVDVSVYDIMARVAALDGKVPESYQQIFDTDPAVLRDLSPVTHVAEGKSIPPFLILHVADRDDTKIQSHLFAEALKAAGIPAEVVAAEGKTHGTISTDLGRADDPPTQAVFRFVDEQLQK